MNTRIQQYFETIEARLIESVAILSYEILRKEVGPTDGKIRLKAFFIDDSSAEAFEYVVEQVEGVFSKKYSFHWQDEAGHLRRRWDNAPHFPAFSLPDHVHAQDGSVEPLQQRLSLLEILDLVEQAFLRNV